MTTITQSGSTGIRASLKDPKLFPLNSNVPADTGKYFAPIFDLTKVRSMREIFELSSKSAAWICGAAIGLVFAAAIGIIGSLLGASFPLVGLVASPITIYLTYKWFRKNFGSAEKLYEYIHEQTSKHLDIWFTNDKGTSFNKEDLDAWAKFVLMGDQPYIVISSGRSSVTAAHPGFKDNNGNTWFLNLDESNNSYTASKVVQVP
jgi:hypothetical protein